MKVGDVRVGEIRNRREKSQLDGQHKRPKYFRKFAKSFDQHGCPADSRRERTNGVSLEIADLAGIPIYNDDVCQDDFPAAIETLRGQIRDVDVLLFATPE